MEEIIQVSGFEKLQSEKVFIGTPTSDKKNYCLDIWLDRVDSLTYKNKELFIADNSETRDNVKMFAKRGINCEHIRPKNKPVVQYVWESQEFLRRYFLKTKATWYLNLESDVIPPTFIIEQLLSHQKAIVAAPYFIGYGENSGLGVILREGIGGDIISTHKLEPPEDINFLDGKLKPVYHAGIGCILIHRSVMEKIPFRYEKGIFHYPDTYFAMDCNAKGYSIFLDTSILCEHHNSYYLDKVN